MKTKLPIQWLAAPCLTLAFVFLLAVHAQALPLHFTGSHENAGFAGSVEYDDKTLTIFLKNTGQDGILTGFVFHAPQVAAITDVDFSTPWLLLDGRNGVTAGPDGRFQFGATAHANFMGGNTAGGLAYGEHASFTFDFDEPVFLLESFSYIEPILLARFQGLPRGGNVSVAAEWEPEAVETILTASMRQNGNNPVVPEPATLSLLGLGLMGMAIQRYRMRAASSA